MAQKPFQEFFTALDQVIGTLGDVRTEAGSGVVASARDGVIQMTGLPGVRLGDVVHIEEANVDALVLQVERDGGQAVILDRGEEVREGLIVTTTGKTLGLHVSEALLGRVIDPLGLPQDEKKPVTKGTFMPLEALAPDVMSRISVTEPVQTGILAIDALIPIGRGQRELIIGDRQTGKTTIAIDTILNQKDQDVICIYVAIGQREAKTAQVVRTLTEHGAMAYTVVVNASASMPAVLQYLAPYAGAAIGEYFMKLGRHVIVVFDDLSKHAVAYREISLLLRKPPGREAYPGDVFYLHSRLLERAAKLKPELGGGSMTALPIVETLAGDVSAYIPTNVISITDGQIFLDAAFFNRGIRPAINIGISVSRVGGAAQTKLMKKASGTAKLDLAQYYELAAFSQFSSDLDIATRKQLTRGERVVEALKQKPQAPYPLWQQAVILTAASQGLLDDWAREDVAEMMPNVLAVFEAKHAKLVEQLMARKELTDELKPLLTEAVKEEFSKHKKHARSS